MTKRRERGMVLRMAMIWSNSPDDQEEGARHGLENGHDLVELT